MRFVADPMPALIAKAEIAIDNYFNAEASGSIQKDAEYAVKRAVAVDVLAAGENAATGSFIAEANLMQMSVTAFAKIISTKPDTVADRGLRRRTAILAARAAKTPPEIDAIVARYGPPTIG